MKDWNPERAVVGTVVAVSGRWDSAPYLYQIARETRTTVVLGGHDALRIRKADGHIVGSDTWSRRHVWMPDEAEMVTIRAQQQRETNYRRVRNTEWNKLTDDQLARVVAILTESDHA